ncbi:MAG: maltose alpha-D-glucosyltransferase [Pirellulaceae bacterium]|nr:maltose alpha-D-glucosyltransferase [Pirellulaceae bacterium]
MATVTRRQATSISTTPAEADALWYKDAVVYQLHVRSFLDSNSDGIGDLRGLTARLDYIQDLGVTAIWLLPFFPSPLRDDGYDIADYTAINPSYGTLRDFKALVREAHARGLRVITELVLNHTSDQHEWFQRSRRSPPGSRWRDFYVWSDTTDRYRDARIIFQDFESSNWTWDPVAGAHYWHRFYHHQPDLNFDNPEVHAAMLKVIDFWLALGVDGVRLDAVPYLYEREGTNCENLPETHAFLRKLRQHVDQQYPDRMLLAEANQWPEDAAAYFGDGDECHMNFHFPLMPRLFMAVEREDRFAIIDILDQTPTIPPVCQWGIFLRNHDELTLEMVTDEERDYMYRTFADDPRARINLGIRRRLAPLLKNDRRKIELMNALLLSLPGTPIIYYGDELGMGDNIYLGDRNGVRTPMQWNADRNGGFSSANPQRLFLPVIIDAEYHYSTVNVEVEQNSPHSLLWWMRRIIHLRKQFRAFGRGSLEFVSCENPKVLAYLRRHEDETLLVVANLSRFAQAAELDLSAFRGQHPIELFGQARFPPVGELPYFLTLGPHAFYWFKLAWHDDEISSVGIDLPGCTIAQRWDNLFTGKACRTLLQALPAYLRRQRWFAGKARKIQQVGLVDYFAIQGPAESSAMRLLLVDVQYVDGEAEKYLLPVVFAQGEQACNITGDHPRGGILRVERSDGEPPAVLCEAMWEDLFWHPLHEAIRRRRVLRGQHGEIHAEQTKAYRRLASGLKRQAGPPRAVKAARELNGDEPPTVAIHGGQQSNTSVILGERFILKIFRCLNAGENPDLEIGRFLTQETQLSCVPELAAALTYQPLADQEQPAGAAANGDSITLGIMHELVANEGDAWVYTLDELGRFAERVEAELPELDRRGQLPPHQSPLDLIDQRPPDYTQELIGPYLRSIALLGKRTAEMHQALAGGKTAAFVPEPFTLLYQRGLYQSMRAQTRRAFALLRRQLPVFDEDLREQAAGVAQREGELLERFRRVLDRKISALRTRCHGDYHLGQVLFTGNDFVIIDFEGEPQRPISERRIKTSPLRDVAGMLRSLHYASHAARLGQAPGGTGRGVAAGDLQTWFQIWYTWSSAAFLEGYARQLGPTNLLPQDRDELKNLLDAHVLEKAVYELVYELNNRPDWVRIPLEGILELVGPS